MMVLMKRKEKKKRKKEELIRKSVSLNETGKGSRGVGKSEE